MPEEALRVLIIEDNPADVRLVLHELRQAGFHLDVIQVDNETEYLERLDLAPDIILSDYNLPQFDAVRALELVRERRPGIPFLIVSGSIGEETAVEVIKRGADDYLLKDRLGRLGPAVKQALKQRELRDAEHRAQRRLKESESRLQLALDAAQMGVWEWKISTDRVFWSPECYKLLGVATFAGTFEAFEGFLHPDDKDRVKNEIQAAVVQQTPFVTEFRVIRPDGEVRWLANFGRATYANDGSPLQMIGTVQDISERKRADEELRAGRERLQALSRKLMTAQEDERRHIARELHDEIGQALTGIKLNLNDLKRALRSETDKATWQDTMAIANQTLEQVRNLSLDLRPSMLDDLGLVAALRWYLDRQARRAGFAVQFVDESAEANAPKEVESACFRILQECLTNIARHARARHVRVELHRRDCELELLVADDGIGFDVAAAREHATRGASLGLLGMQERVLLLGGQFSIESVPSRGTQMRVRFPLNFPTQDADPK